MSLNKHGLDSDNIKKCPYHVKYIDSFGEVKPGDRIVIENKNGCSFSCIVKLVESRCDECETIYFSFKDCIGYQESSLVVSEMIRGASWVRSACYKRADNGSAV
jgi:hypothetical protein